MQRDLFHVLILDRDPRRRERLRTTLEEKVWVPMEVTTAARPEEVVPTPGPSFDVALLSLASGEEVLAPAQALAAHLPDVPIVAIGGELEDMDLPSLIRCGVQDHIPLRCAECPGSGRLMSSLSWAMSRAHFLRRIEQLQRESDRRALHDPLTDLPNRKLFRNRLRHLLAQSARRQTSFAVLFVDLDRFKQVNDTHGHDVGDDLLREVARRLRGCLRESDTCARWGGDEFTILLEGVRSSEGAARVARKILAAISEPLPADGRELSCTASIGISRYPSDGRDERVLIRRADLAMYRAKSAGGNRWRLGDAAGGAAGGRRRAGRPAPRAPRRR